MSDYLLMMIGVVAAVAAVIVWPNLRLRHLSRERLLASFPEEEVEFAPTPPVGFVRRHRLPPWILAGAVCAALYFLVGVRIAYSGSLGLVVGLLASLVEVMLVERRIKRIEAQLADSIDIMVGGLRAGASLLNALTSATQESREPLRPQLEEVIGRIQLGDDPRTAFAALSDRVGLETFLLFSTALAVHWEVGGSLAPTLASVARTVRDRIELSRRVQGMTAQTRTSIIALLGAIYFIAAVMWNSDPDRMQAFLATNLGSSLVAAAIALQATGIVWTSAISRVKF